MKNYRYNGEETKHRVFVPTLRDGVEEQGERKKTPRVES